jgi:hypothetical protein
MVTNGPRVISSTFDVDRDESRMMSRHLVANVHHLRRNAKGCLCSFGTLTD